MAYKKTNNENCTEDDTNIRLDHLGEMVERIHVLLISKVESDSLPQYLTVKETHQLLRVSRRTLYRWIERGEINPVQMPGSRSLLFPKQEILNKIK